MSHTNACTLLSRPHNVISYGTCQSRILQVYRVYLRRNTWRESEKIVCVSVRVGALGIVDGMMGKADTPVTSYRIS